MLDITRQVGCGRGRNLRHIRLVNVVYPLSKTSHLLWLCLDVDVLLTGLSNLVRLPLWHQCDVFISRWCGTGLRGLLNKISGIKQLYMNPAELKINVSYQTRVAIDENKSLLSIQPWVRLGRWSRAGLAGVIETGTMSAAFEE